MKISIQKNTFSFLPTAFGLVFLMAALFTVASAHSVSTAHAARWIPENFTELAEKYSPAVVNIRSEKNGKRRMEVDPQFRGAPMTRTTRSAIFLRNFSGAVQTRDSSREAWDQDLSSTMTVTSSPTTMW